MSNFRFIKLREEYDLTQQEIANKLGVLRNTYSKWENNINDIPLDILNKLANFYNCSLDYLLGLSNKITIKERKDINLELLSKRLLELRKEHKLTQEEISKETDFHQRTYAHYENGSRIPTTFKLYKLVIFYKTSFDYLVGKSDIK